MAGRYAMRVSRLFGAAALLATVLLSAILTLADQPPGQKTTVSIDSAKFLINGQPTYQGREWNGHSIEGLLFNIRMVQATFDDLNPETRSMWAYPDTDKWDSDRNTREFVAALPEYRRHGVRCFTLNLQGGNPRGYGRGQPWHNSAIEPDGSLRRDYLNRFEQILDRADELGMVVILGIFYFGQDQRVDDEAAILRATDATVAWLLERGYRNVLVEVNNECNLQYDHAILRPERVHELIERVKAHSLRDGRRLLVSTSYGGGTVPQENVVRAADFLLIHGNGQHQPERITRLVQRTREVAGYRPMPIVINEDDHFEFEKPTNNLLAAVNEYCSWGYFEGGEGNYRDGYQSPPVNWGINTEHKRGFFELVKRMTGEH